jgi:hypothetical protein
LANCSWHFKSALSSCQEGTAQEKGYLKIPNVHVFDDSPCTSPPKHTHKHKILISLSVLSSYVEKGAKTKQWQVQNLDGRGLGKTLFVALS